MQQGPAGEEQELCRVPCSDANLTSSLLPSLPFVFPPATNFTLYSSAFSSPIGITTAISIIYYSHQFSNSAIEPFPTTDCYISDRALCAHWIPVTSSQWTPIPFLELSRPQLASTKVSKRCREAPIVVASPQYGGADVCALCRLTISRCTGASHLPHRRAYTHARTFLR